ncbi:S8 family serine peptidase [[Pseudomonas] boreopolis]|uniref:S8 family serine peptidase n=1 Tax=Xanthomonas boreopolis TaxID=86183 RepID=UPI003D9B1282
MKGARGMLWLGLLAVAGAARAQVALPPVTLPGGMGGVGDRLLAPVRQLGDEVASSARVERIDALLRRHRRELDRDPAGAPVVRSEVVAVAPAPQALEAARAAGFSVGQERRLEELGLTLVVLQAPPGMSTAQALKRLRALDPAGQYDFNHVYLDAQAEAPVPVPPPAAMPVATAPYRVGLVDSGVDPRHPALRTADVIAHGCEGTPVAQAHATAVASLLLGGRAGAPAGSRLYAADVYCGRAAGGSVVALAEALAWMAREDVPVVNVSLTGPANGVLQRAVAGLVARGHLLVAAVGNDGPSAPPLYPAAYPGVVGVTAVDPRGRVLPEACRGPQVAFAALGSRVPAAAPGGGWAEVRGTSFAAPRVARLAALRLRAADPQAAAAVRAALAAEAQDLGTPGPDPTYGQGLLGGLSPGPAG